MSSALRTDRILVLDGAHAILAGHDELLTGCGLYADLIGHWNMEKGCATSTSVKGATTS